MTPDISKQTIRGVICPVCAHVDAIVEESYTRPWDSGDVIDVAVGGWVSAVMISFGRTKKQLRCGRCSCRFSRSPGLFTKVFWWVLLTAIVLLIAGALAGFFQSSVRSGTLSPVSDICQWLSLHPLVALVLLASLLLIMLCTAVVAHTNAASERRHLYHALEKRESGELVVEAPNDRPPEPTTKFYRR